MCTCVRKYYRVLPWCSFQRKRFTVPRPTGCGNRETCVLVNVTVCYRGVLRTKQFAVPCPTGCGNRETCVLVNTTVCYRGALQTNRFAVLRPTGCGNRETCVGELLEYLFVVLRHLLTR